MAKIAAWLIVIIGLLLLLPALGVALPDWIVTWIIPLMVLAIGIIKVMIKYK